MGQNALGFGYEQAGCQIIPPSVHQYRNKLAEGASFRDGEFDLSFAEDFRNFQNRTNSDRDQYWSSCNWWLFEEVLYRNGIMF